MSLEAWQRDQPLSILQLDPADRAVLRIAGRTFYNYLQKSQCLKHCFHFKKKKTLPKIIYDFLRSINTSTGNLIKISGNRECLFYLPQILKITYFIELQGNTLKIMLIENYIYYFCKCLPRIKSHKCLFECLKLNKLFSK